MKTFKEFVESKMLGDQSNMRLVGDTLKGAVRVGIDAFADYMGVGLAKNIFSAALNQRKGIMKKIQDDNAIKKATEIIRSRISQKAQNRSGNMEAMIESYIGATDESQSLLNDQERQLIINAIIEAINNNSIKSGFTQQLVNSILQEKINTIQGVLQSSKPKSLVI